MSEQKIIEALELLKEWVESKIDAGIADSVEDSSGYIGGGYAENRLAENKFNDLKKYIEESFTAHEAKRRQS